MRKVTLLVLAFLGSSLLSVAQSPGAGLTKPHDKVEAGKSATFRFTLHEEILVPPTGMRVDFSEDGHGPEAEGAIAHQFYWAQAPKRVSGDGQNTVFEVELPIPPNLDEGTYHLSQLMLVFDSSSKLYKFDSVTLQVENPREAAFKALDKSTVTNVEISASR